MANSVGGTLTGEGGEFLVLDDPHNPANINSRTIREGTINWYEQVFSSRLDDKKNGVIVLIMQRLHHEDLTNYLLEKNPNTWHRLIIPSYTQADIKYQSPLNKNKIYTFPAETPLQNSK